MRFLTTQGFIATKLTTRVGMKMSTRVDMYYTTWHFPRRLLHKLAFPENITTRVGMYPAIRADLTAVWAARLPARGPRFREEVAFLTTQVDYTSWLILPQFTTQVGPFTTV